MKNKRRILIVEDDISNLELFCDVINTAGYECIHASNGESALEIAKREKPDLILLDIQLPGLDGISVKNRLKSLEETKDIRIVALTAYAMKGDKEMFLNEGFDGYISKPIKIKEFIQIIQEYLC